jgi:hypothetical protein
MKISKRAINPIPFLLPVTHLSQAVKPRYTLPPAKTPVTLFPHIKPQKTTLQPPMPLWSGERLKQERVIPHLLTVRGVASMERISHTKNFTATLPCEGILKRAPDGHLFLKLSNKFITEFALPGTTRPPYFHQIERVGAHITIMTPTEGKTVKEIGKKYTFKITGCYKVHPEKWDGIHTAYILTVESKELEYLREKYHLSSTPHSHPFSIVVAIERGTARETQTYLQVSPTATSA